MGINERSGRAIPPVVASETGEIDDTDEVSWGNLFSVNATYQREDVPSGKYFEMYMGDATPPDQQEYTRDMSVHAFLPDNTGRPQVLVVNVYLDNVHTQVFMAAAVWEEEGPNVLKLSSSEVFEYKPESALNFAEAAVEATKIILRLENDSPAAPNQSDGPQTASGNGRQYYN